MALIILLSGKDLKKSESVFKKKNTFLGIFPFIEKKYCNFFHSVCVKLIFPLFSKIKKSMNLKKKHHLLHFFLVSTKKSDSMARIKIEFFHPVKMELSGEQEFRKVKIAEILIFFCGAIPPFLLMSMRHIFCVTFFAFSFSCSTM